MTTAPFSRLTGRAVNISADWIWLGVQVGLADFSRAAAPVMCGVAIEVPVWTLLPVPLPEAAMILVPGAVMSGLTTPIGITGPRPLYCA